MAKWRYTLVSSAALALGTGSAHAQQATPQETASSPRASISMMGATAPATNLEKSLDFYTKGLGMIAGPRVDGPTVVEVPLQFPGGGPFILLYHPKRAGTAVPRPSSFNRIMVAVSDVRAIEARLKGAGYTLKAPIQEFPEYKAAVGRIEDPDGTLIELTQRGN